MKKIVVISLLVMLFAGCSETEQTDKVEGTITVVTHFTDAEEEFAEIEKAFIAKYPDVKDIIWETPSGDYDEYITTKMTTGDYGDVLIVPFSLTTTPEELESFIEPLGKISEMTKEYTFADHAIYGDNTYALPISLNTLGYIYNEDVFNEAGIESFPTSSEEMYEASEAILAKTDAIPWYSNLNEFPMLWAGAITSYGGTQYMSDILEKGTLVEEGQPYREIYDYIYTMITKGYTEKDPMTGDLGESMQLVANGDVGSIVMGSMVLDTVKSMSDNPDAIKMAPFTVQYDGKSYMPYGADELIGVSNKSSNKATAKAFLEFFVSPESGFAYNNGGFSPLLNSYDDAPAGIKEQLETFELVRTIATEDTDTYSKFNEISRSANIPSIKVAITDLLGVAINDGDYDAWLKEQEETWQKAMSDNE